MHDVADRRSARCHQKLTPGRKPRPPVLSCCAGFVLQRPVRDLCRAHEDALHQDRAYWRVTHPHTDSRPHFQALNTKRQLTMRRYNAPSFVFQAQFGSEVFRRFYPSLVPLQHRVRLCVLVPPQLVSVWQQSNVAVVRSTKET